MRVSSSRRQNRLVAVVGSVFFLLCEVLAVAAVLKAVDEDNLPVAVAFSAGALLGLGALVFFAVALTRARRNGRL